MRDLNRSEAIGLISLLGLITVVVGVTALRSASPAIQPGIVLRDPVDPASTARPLGEVDPDRTVVARPDSPEPSAQPDAVRRPTAAPPQAGASSPPPEEAELVVHVAGAVRKPGVYHLKSGARGADALQAAGGPTAAAGTDSINLAARLADGMQLYIPTRKERPAGFSDPASPSARPQSAYAERRTAHGKSGSEKPAKMTDPSSDRIDLNHANAEQLQRLPGIGPAMAGRILAFRKENQGFRSVDDLMQVSGIGERKLEKIKPFVCVK